MGVLACGHPFPVEYGPRLPSFLKDAKLDEFHAIVVFQEIARAGSIGVGWGLGAGLCIGLPPVLHHGSEYLKQKVAPGVLRGEKVICLAVTEPNAGSDVSNVQTSAVKSECGKFYIVNGVKKWITNGVFADYMTVLVRTKQGAGAKGLSMLLIETDSPGVKRQKMKCSGVWCSGTTLITFDNVKVPFEHLIGKENKGFKYCVSNFNHERLIICAQAVASARVCYEEAWKHAHRRRTFGKLLVEHEVIRFKLGDMARSVESCQAWLENLAFQIETMHPQEATMKLSGVAALLKVQCTKVLEFCAREASQVYGGLSFTRGGLGEMVERLSREVKSLAIPGGSEEIMVDLGVKMTNKLSQLGQQILANPDGGMFAKQLSLARRVGVNMDLFGEGLPFADPSWYLTFNSAYFNASHSNFREYMRSITEAPEDIVEMFTKSGLSYLAAGYPYSVELGSRIEALNGVQVDLFHELIAIDELSRLGDAGLVRRLWSQVSESVALLKALPSNESISGLIEEVRSGRTRVALPIESDLGDSLEIAVESHYSVTGSVRLVSGAESANAFIVPARTGDSVSLFQINRDSKVAITRQATSSMASSGLFEVRFTGSQAILLGEVGKAKEYLAKCQVGSRWTVCVESIRLARVCYEEALKFAQESNALSKKQGIRWNLGEMARQIEGAYNWLETVTYDLSSSGGKISQMTVAHVALLKMHCSRMLEYCTRQSGHILGSTSILHGNAVERISKDVGILNWIGGTDANLLDQGIQLTQARKKSDSENASRL
jgi:alkylation response protein AidB-like acyl-CoA dehydrogenase